MKIKNQSRVIILFKHSISSHCASPPPLTFTAQHPSSLAVRDLPPFSASPPHRAVRLSILTDTFILWRCSFVQQKEKMSPSKKIEPEEVEGEIIGTTDYFFVKVGEALPLKSSDSVFDAETLPSQPLALSERFRLTFVAHSSGQNELNYYVFN